MHEHVLKSASSHAILQEGKVQRLLGIMHFKVCKAVFIRYCYRSTFLLVHFYLPVLDNTSSPTASFSHEFAGWITWIWFLIIFTDLSHRKDHQFWNYMKTASSLSDGSSPTTGKICWRRCPAQSTVAQTGGWTAGARRSMSQCARTANLCCYTCNRRSKVRWSYGTLSSFS